MQIDGASHADGLEETIVETILAFRKVSDFTPYLDYLGHDWKTENQKLPALYLVFTIYTRTQSLQWRIYLPSNNNNNNTVIGWRR